MTNRELRALRAALRNAYDHIPKRSDGTPDPNIVYGFDKFTDAIEENTECCLLYLQDLHPDLDPPDNDEPVREVSDALCEALDRDHDSITIIDWYYMSKEERDRWCDKYAGRRFDDFGRDL